MRQGRSNCATFVSLKGGEGVGGRLPALICASTGVAPRISQGMSADFGSCMLRSSVSGSKRVSGYTFCAASAARAGPRRRDQTVMPPMASTRKPPKPASVGSKGASK